MTTRNVQIGGARTTLDAPYPKFKLSTKPAASRYKNETIAIDIGLKGATCYSDGFNWSWTSIPEFNVIAELPSAIAFGVGQVRVGGVLYDSDGVIFKSLDTGSTAISSTQAGVIVASFVYDTTKDSDGGAWRDRSSHLSWYNETLNTATRGATRKFPAVAGIVATTSTVTIYDLTDAAAPMWMVFSPGSFLGWTPYTSLFAINGKVYRGSNNGSGSGELYIADFLVNDFYYYSPSGVFRSNSIVDGLVSRNIAGTAAIQIGIASIVASTVNCITATVLPTAPIDNATGLPVPTVWVGTLGGVSRIADDGTVSNWTESGSVDDVYNIGITGDYAWWGTDANPNGTRLQTISVTSALSAWTYNSTAYNHYDSNETSGWLSTKTPIFYNGFASLVRDISKNAIATSRSLTLLQPNTTNWGSGLHATITKDFNSGYQFGDIRGAWLCQGAAETLTGTDLITGDSSTFTAGVGSWVGYSSTLSVSGGALSVVASATYGSAAIAITTVVGKTYVVSIDSKTSVGGTTTEIFAGTGANNANLSPVVAGTTGTTFVTSSFSFVATTTTTYITMRCTVASTVFFDNVTVKLAEPDVSYKNQALTVVGSITKAAVATGCDLMGYSGFSASNYLTQAYRSDLDFGTGDFHVSVWVNLNSIGASHFIVDRGLNGLANSFNRIVLYVNSSGAVAVQTFDSAGASTLSTSTGVLSSGAWVKINAIRGTSGTTSIYINGVLDTQLTGTTVRTVTSTVNSLFVGINASQSTWLLGKLALLHISAGAPTAAQIKNAYDREKLMFVAGNKCLLPGTSNDVKAVAYDDNTDTYHYVTGDYYGAHKGLVRVDSAAGVYTSISANNGTIIKGA